VVVPVTRLLEPSDVEGLHEPGEADRIGRRPAAVRVDREHEIGAGGAPSSLHALRVRLGRERADLELAAGHAGPPVVLDLVADMAEALAVHVVAADRDDRQAPPVAADQRGHRSTDRLAAHIPRRTVDAGDRLEEQLLPAARVRQREQPFPHALAFEEIQPPHDRLEVLANHAYDLGTLFTVVAVVHGAHESVVRAQPRDHRGTLDDRVRAAPEVLPERDVDGHRLDAVDAHGSSLRGTAPVCQGAAVMTFLTWWFAPAQYLGI